MRITLGSGRSCELRLVPVPLLRHYYVLCFEPGEPTDAEAAEMFTIAVRKGTSMAQALLGRPGAYTLIQSGPATRRSRGWHLHLLLVPGRLAKAWLYFVLAGKNLLQALRLQRRAPRPLRAAP